MKTGDLIKEYTLEGNHKLDDQYTGTKQAILLIAEEKVREFMLAGDVGLGKEERDLMVLLTAGAMMQSFSLGFGVGKVEGVTKKPVFL